ASWVRSSTVSILTCADIVTPGLGELLRASLFAAFAHISPPRGTPASLADAKTRLPGRCSRRLDPPLPRLACRIGYFCCWRGAHIASIATQLAPAAGPKRSVGAFC